MNEALAIRPIRPEVNNRPVVGLKREQENSLGDRRFVVLTTNRSGSVWVMSTLNALEGVTAQGELFLPRPRARERRWDSDHAHPRFVETRPPEPRPWCVFRYLDGLYRETESTGFKLMYSQLWGHPEILLYLVRHHVPVVHLVRRNHLDVLISFAVKGLLGRAHVLDGQTPPEDLRVELDPSHLVPQLRWLDRKQSIGRRVLRWSRLAHLEVAYEDLVRDSQQFVPIFEFLGLQHRGVPPAKVVRIRRGGQAQVVRNYEEVAEKLRGSEFAGLLDAGDRELADAAASSFRVSGSSS